MSYTFCLPDKNRILAGVIGVALAFALLHSAGGCQNQSLAQTYQVVALVWMSIEICGLIQNMSRIDTFTQ